MPKPQQLDELQARKLAEEIVTFAAQSDAVHWASFFDSQPENYPSFCNVLEEDAYCQEQINAARSLIGRRVLKHAIYEKCTPLHKDLIRWHMDDFNEFLHNTNKREYEERVLSETQAGNAAIDKIAELLSPPHAE